MRKLRLMEKSQGIWTMECQILVDVNYLIVYDKKNGVSKSFNNRISKIIKVRNFYGFCSGRTDPWNLINFRKFTKFQGI